MGLLPCSITPAQEVSSSTGITEVERVIVTGSNIPTAEETGPNPVDTYRPQDLEKLGIRNATDLTTFLPQEAGGTMNLNITNSGLGTVLVAEGNIGVSRWQACRLWSGPRCQ
jgi:hypothetical protein